MAGIVDEVLLLRGGVFLRGEHGVEGVAEPREFVVAAGRDLQAYAGGAGGDLLGPGSVALDRLQRRAGQSVADERGNGQRGQVGQCELAEQFTQRLVPLVETDRGEAERDLGATAEPDRLGRDAQVLSSPGEQVALLDR